MHCELEEGISWFFFLLGKLWARYGIFNYRRKYQAIFYKEKDKFDTLWICLKKCVNAYVQEVMYIISHLPSFGCAYSGTKI